MILRLDMGRTLLRLAGVTVRAAFFVAAQAIFLFGMTA
jgi:hypothetical protein